MITVDLRALVGKLNDHSRRALEAAAGLCLSKTHYEVEIEHFLLKLSEQADGDVAALYRHYEVNHARATQEIMRALDRLKTGNSRAPALSPRLPKLVRDAWVLASVQYDMPRVRSGLILLALVSDEDTQRLLYESSRELRRLSPERMASELRTVIAGSSEDEGAAAEGGEPGAAPGAPGTPGASGGKTPGL